MRLAIEARCRETGATPVCVHIPLPTDADQIAQRILDAAGPAVKLAVLDHISSGTALVFPITRIAPELKRRGILLCVDGAHAIGQLPLDLAALGADWYFSNLHKWMFAPRGCAFLHAADTVRAFTRPVLTSHYIDMGFPHSYDYVGTRDYTAWLAAPCAMDFFSALGGERIRAHAAAVVDAGTALLAEIGAIPVAPRDLSASMRTMHLPQTRAADPDDATALIQSLWQQHRIQVRGTTHDDRLLLRFSAPPYVDASDVQQLANALQTSGWPGRA